MLKKASLFTQTIALIFLNLFRATEVASDDTPESVGLAVPAVVPDLTVLKTLLYLTYIIQLHLKI